MKSPHQKPAQPPLRPASASPYYDHRALLPKVDHGWYHLGWILQVSIEKNYCVPVSLIQSGPVRSLLTEVTREFDNAPAP
jgi:hypothetical protein